MRRLLPEPLNLPRKRGRLCSAALGGPVEPDVNRTIPASPSDCSELSSGCLAAVIDNDFQFHWPVVPRSSKPLAWQSASSVSGSRSRGSIATTIFAASSANSVATEPSE